MRMHMRSFASAALAVIGWAAILVAPTGASAAIVTIESTVHAFWVPSSGSDTSSVIVRHPPPPQTILPEVRGVIEFDISGLTSPVLLAELSLTKVSSTLFSEKTINVLGYTGNGVFDQSDGLSGSFVTSFSYFSQATATVDVTTFINAQIAMADPDDDWAGLVLLFPSPIGTTETVNFGNSVDTYPDLVVTVVPLPAALPLFLTALAGLGLFARQRRRKQGAVG